MLKPYAASPARQKMQVLVAGYLIALAMAISLFYFFRELFGPEAAVRSSMHLVFLLASASALALIRAGHHGLAVVLQLFFVTGFVLYFSLVSSPSRGNFLFFLTNGLSSFALLGYERRKWAWGMAGLQYVLLLLFLAGGVAGATVSMSFLINLSLLFWISAGIIFFMLYQNHRSEADIGEKNALLEKTNQELDRFLYSTSHDVRAPLASIKGLIALTERSDDKAEVKLYLGLMQKRLADLERFTFEITDYARNARTDVLREKLSICAVVQEVAGLLSPAENGSSPVPVQIDLVDDWLVYSDAARLKVIFSNLIGNAIKYADVRKATPRVRISAMRRENELEIAVQDNGQGIRPEHQTRVFDMFYRGTDATPGTGLGLFIANEAARRIGARISLTSVYGEGSRFVVHLPLN